VTKETALMRLTSYWSSRPQCTGYQSMR